MIGLDTNVLVRYLTQDDRAQALRAEAAILSATTGGRRCAIAGIVLCELVWVLREAYNIPKAEIVAALDGILVTGAFEVIDRERVQSAVEHYRQGPADFADYLIGEAYLEAGCTETVTFDRAVRGAPGFRTL